MKEIVVMNLPLFCLYILILYFDRGYMILYIFQNTSNVYLIKPNFYYVNYYSINK